MRKLEVDVPSANVDAMSQRETNLLAQSFLCPRRQGGGARLLPSPCAVSLPSALIRGIFADFPVFGMPLHFPVPVRTP